MTDLQDRLSVDPQKFDLSIMDKSEVRTRKEKIDPILKQAGWTLGQVLLN